MLTTDQMENLRTVGEGIGFLVMIVLGRREVRDALRRVRKRVPLSIAEPGELDTGDERIAVRRSELNVLVRKMSDLVRKVDNLVDMVEDHQNRLDEADREKTQVSVALRDLTTAIGAIRTDIAQLSTGA